MQIETYNYKLTFEEDGGKLFCHLDVYNWSVAVYKQMLIELNSIIEATQSLWCNVAKNSKEYKLVSMFGFTPVYETDRTYIMECR